jgi:hypothetical protein
MTKMIDRSHRGFFFIATALMCAACFYASDLVRSEANDAVDVAIRAPRQVVLTPSFENEIPRIGSNGDCATESTPSETVAVIGCDRPAVEQAAMGSSVDLKPKPFETLKTSLGSASFY